MRQITRPMFHPFKIHRRTPTVKRFREARIFFKRGTKLGIHGSASQLTAKARVIKIAAVGIKNIDQWNRIESSEPYNYGH